MCHNCPSCNHNHDHDHHHHDHHDHDHHHHKSCKKGGCNCECCPPAGRCASQLGYKTSACGPAAHAEGQETVSSSNATHAEGRETVACGKYGHAEGYKTVASGLSSHAQGYKSEANGIVSTSIGQNIVVNGDRSVGIQLDDEAGRVLGQHGTLAVVGGKVGIETLAPTSTLHVVGTSTLGTVEAGTWQGDIISVAKGGTNADNATSARTNLGLGNVDNTSDLNKPISIATQAALDLKAPINNPTFTGTVNGITKGMVGLGNVDNTSDLDKPISTSTQAALDLKANLVDGLVPASQLPSYVDDVEEYIDLAGFPATGETSKIYVAKDTNKTYRWSGSIYVEISASPGSTDSVPEGSTNLYFRNDRAAAAAPVQSVAGKIGTVTLAKSDVGLGNVDNTSDLNKPVSTATQTALDLKSDKKSIDGIKHVFPGTTFIPELVDDMDGYDLYMSNLVWNTDISVVGPVGPDVSLDFQYETNMDTVVLWQRSDDGTTWESATGATSSSSEVLVSGRTKISGNLTETFVSGRKYRFRIAVTTPVGLVYVFSSAIQPDPSSMVGYPPTSFSMALDVGTPMAEGPVENGTKLTLRFFQDEEGGIEVSFGDSYVFPTSFVMPATSANSLRVVVVEYVAYWNAWRVVDDMSYELYPSLLAHKAKTLSW